MTDTLSPTLNAQMFQHLTSAYQRLLLAEMGITPWVGQSELVQTFTVEEIFFAAEPENSPALTETTIKKPANFLPTSPTQADTQSPVLLTPLLNPSPPAAHEYSQPNTSPQIHTTSTLPLPPLLPQTLPPIRCHYYAIHIRNWVILADAELLHSHPQALTLWQNMTRTLSTRQYEFRFPLNGSHPPSEANPALLVQASFAGFLCAIQHGSHLDNGEGLAIKKSLQTTIQTSPKVGIVTPIADWLENDNVQRLPYLTEMLEDYRQKRQFWHLMIANTP